MNSKRDVFQTEAALCKCFIDTLNALGGWTVYPETAGYDILAVYKTGHQLGVEAKLRLNAKVADQILPQDNRYAYNTRGPDWRAVIVPQLTDASHGISRLLGIVGVMVWTPSYLQRQNEAGRWDFTGALHAPYVNAKQAYDAEDMDHAIQCHKDSGFRLPFCPELCWHDWNPLQRCTLPEIVPNVPAGVPAPVRLTPWKIGALKVMAEIELYGFVTAMAVRSHGIDPRRFCATDGWLTSLGNGKWGRGEIPAFDQQHPEAYAQILSALRKKNAEARAA